MSGDYSRTRFDTLQDFAGVFMQQGHPTLDADWNELVAILERRLRAGTVDTIGRAAVPRETSDGFRVTASAGKIGIGRGRIYVDGLLAENHGRIDDAHPPVLDRARGSGVLDEMVADAGGDVLDYATQPYLPDPPALPQGPGPHLAYLDAWNREVTPLKDPSLLEPALGGIDTATRLQTVWQLRLLPDIGAGVGCNTALPAWDALVAPSALRLTNDTIEYEDPDEPCIIPPGGGYRGLENQLYRVEIHAGGAPGAARFKWSRDNASVGAGVEAIEGGLRLRVRRIGRDSVLRFRTGDWVEVTDDRREFAGLAGDMRRVEVDEDANELRLHKPLSADLLPGGGADTTASRHTRVIRWDQRGAVLLDDGTAWADLDDPASDGLIPVPPAGQAVVLEAGITVSFSAQPAGGAGRPLDHWCFTARTATADIERLRQAPPRGIHHHYARLAVVTFPDSATDCREIWPPQSGEDCCCTFCVSSEAHNSGTLTIQDAIDRLPDFGGTLCLGPGDFMLGDKPVLISGRASVRVKGHGSGTSLAYTGTGGAVRVADGRDVVLEDFRVFVVRGGAEEAMPPAAFHLRNGAGLRLRQVAGIVEAGAEGRLEGIGLALEGNQIGLEVADSLLAAPTAIGTLAEAERQGYCALQEALIRDNALAGERGIALEGLVMHLGATRILGNAIAARRIGILCTGTGALQPPKDEAVPIAGMPRALASVTIRDNSIRLAAEASGVVAGVPGLLVEDNDISAPGGPVERAAAAGIRLVQGFLPRPLPEARIEGNRLRGLHGAGIGIEAPWAALSIRGNLVQDCATGIRSSAEARIGVLTCEGNIVERIAGVMDDMPLAGIAFASVLEARVTGNTIRAVGQPGGQELWYAGVALRGALLSEVSHNTVRELGPLREGGPIFAIRQDGPVLLADISSNRLLGTATEAEDGTGSWAGIVLDGRLEPGADEGQSLAGAKSLPVHVVLDGRVLHLSARGAVGLGAVREVQLRLDGNQIEDARPRNALPLVLVATEPRAQTARCTFSTNQCLRRASAGAIVVALRAGRLVVANNIVRMENDTPAMALESGSFGQNPAATVVGNITFGPIQLNGSSLGMPWAPLNILG
jgi:hypothetical protein